MRSFPPQSEDGEQRNDKEDGKRWIAARAETGGSNHGVAVKLEAAIHDLIGGQCIGDDRSVTAVGNTHAGRYDRYLAFHDDRTDVTVDGG